MENKNDVIFTTWDGYEVYENDEYVFLDKFGQMYKVRAEDCDPSYYSTDKTPRFKTMKGAEIYIALNHTQHKCVEDLAKCLQQIEEEYESKRETPTIQNDRWL